MLLHPKCRFVETTEWPIASTAATLFEGMALINISTTATAFSSGATTSTIGAVKESAGGAGEVFAGFALNVNRLPTTATMVEKVTVPAVTPFTVTLLNTPLTPSTTTSVVTTDGVTALVFNAGVASGQYNLVGTTVTFNTAQAGISYYVVYRYTPSQAQARYLFGDGSVVGPLAPADITGTVGVIRAGIVYTDAFDPSKNWFANAIGDVTSGAGGLLTRAGSGATVRAQVIAAPSVDFPYLGLYFDY